MKQKKPFFDFALYVDTIRRIKTVGIVTAVIIFLCAVGVPIMMLISGIYYDKQGIIHFQQQTISMFTANKEMPFLVYFMGPVMVLQAFSFLNKRNASDFFHSIPYTRICMYVTCFLAAMTWVAGILLGSCILSGITIFLLPKMSLLGSSVGYFLITEFACALLAMGITLFAASLSGTTFNSVFITVILMFAPRILLFIAKLEASGLLPFMPDEGFGFLLDGSYNLLVARPTYLLSELFGNSFENAINAASLSYTIILGLIYLVLGALFFIRRKSEAAGKASANRGIQAVFRTFTAFLFCVPSIAIIIGLIHGEETEAETLLFLLALIIIFYVCAILAFFIYELITTRKWRNCLKAMPGLLVLLALNVIVVAGIELSVRYYSSVRPTAEEISYISIAGTEEDSYYQIGGKDYFTGMTEKVKLTDENLKKIVAEQLVYSIDHWDERYDYAYDDEQNSGKLISYTAYKLKINYGGKTIYRYVLLSQDQIEEMSEVLQQEPSFRNIYMELPKEGVNNTSYYFNNGMMMFMEEDVDISASGISRIVQAYQEDINDMGFEAWYGIKTSNAYYDYETELYGSTSKGLTQYKFSLPIGEKTPKAYAAYMEECNKLAVEKKDFLVKLLRGEASSVRTNGMVDDAEAYIQIGESEDDDRSVYYTVWSFWDSQEQETDTDEEIERLLKEIGDYLEKQDDSFFTEIGNADKILLLNGYLSQWGDDYFDMDISIYLPCDDTLLQLWEELYNYDQIRNRAIPETSTW